MPLGNRKELANLHEATLRASLVSRFLAWKASLQGGFNPEHGLAEDGGGAPKDFSNRGNNMKIPRPRAGQVGGFLVGQIELRRKAL